MYKGTITQNDRFHLRPKFLKLIQSMSGVGQGRTIFGFREVTELLSEYIRIKRHSIFDIRNIKIALIHNDPLGEAFNVQAFHRGQVENLLRSQLFPVTIIPVSTTSRLRQFRLPALTPRVVKSTVTLRNDNV